MLLSSTLLAQGNNIWIAFDKNYYVTKSGKIIGRDSLYMFDNKPDCENEGFIRFRNKKTDNVGLFNRKGEVAIPAEYNELTEVANGVMMALKGAEKKYYEGGEHYRWLGGKKFLIDTTNKIIAENFEFDNDINFFSLKTSSLPNPDTTKQNFITTNRQYISFTNYKKEFSKWLRDSLLKNLSKDNFLNVSFNKVTYWEKNKGWISEIKNIFIERNYELFKVKLIQLNNKNCDYNIFNQGLNPFIFNTDDYRDFFNNCGESKDWKYPVMLIAINYQNKKELQDHFEFLKTENGYKLISVSLSEGEIK